MTEPTLDRIVFLNFGGIGDEILFAPVIQAVREAYPNAHLTLILETRSRSIRDVLPEVDSVLDLAIHQGSRFRLFWRLLKRLRGMHFDAVISSGSSPFIPLLLWLSGIRVRAGFDTGPLSRELLTAPAPLDRTCYAGEMYFSLARAFLTRMKRSEYTDKKPIPRLHAPKEASEKARQLLTTFEASEPSHRIFIHPGVSKVSIKKNILKAWPVASWAELMNRLLDEYPQAQVYLLGGPDDAEVIHALDSERQSLPESLQSRVVNLYGKTGSFLDLAGMTSLADLLISVDSAPLHLGVGLNIPVLAIFGPTDEKKLVPERSNIAVAVKPDLDCRPCLWDVRQTSCENPICLETPVDVVMEKITGLLSGTQSVSS